MCSDDDGDVLQLEFRHRDVVWQGCGGGICRAGDRPRSRRRCQQLRGPGGHQDDQAEVPAATGSRRTPGRPARVQAVVPAATGCRWQPADTAAAKTRASLGQSRRTIAMLSTWRANLTNFFAPDQKRYRLSLVIAHQSI